MNSRKNPFAPISLKGEEAEWFVDYLEGKIKIDPKIKKRRKQLLEEAKSLDVKNPDEIRLRM